VAKQEFAHVDVIRHRDGVVIANVTVCKRPNGGKMFSFNIQKEFKEHDGTERKTSWLARRHIQSIRELLDEVESRLLLEEEKARAAEPRVVS
jgi:hypothetical protein